MNTTSLSLLDRLKRAAPDAIEWQRLQNIYGPLIRTWLRHFADLRDETDDLTQEVLTILFRELPTFERQRDGSFRAWLRSITLNRLRAFQKSRRRFPATPGDSCTEGLLAQLADPQSDLAQQWDREHDRHVFQKLLALVNGDFQEHTWQAFLRFGLEGQSATVVAEELGMTESAVMQAKARILKRLREEAGELLE